MDVYRPLGHAHGRAQANWGATATELRPAHMGLQTTTKEKQKL